MAKALWRFFCWRWQWRKQSKKLQNIFSNGYLSK